MKRTGMTPHQPASAALSATGLASGPGALRTRALVWIFVGSFLFAAFFQGARWTYFGSQDDLNWSNEARFVQENDPRQFEDLNMYGYPGRPVIDGTRILHAVLGVSYPAALVAFMTLGNASLIACIAGFVYWLRREPLWSISVAGMLSLNLLYVHASPPSAITAPLIVLLCLLTLSIEEKRGQPRLLLYGAWALVLGFTVAIRADIGVFSGAFFALVVLAGSNWRRVLAMSAAAFAAFVVFDPYMVTMPGSHVRDLVHKVRFHYAQIAPSALTWGQLWDVSWPLLLSVGLGLVLMVRHRGRRLPIPARFLLFLLAFTICNYAVFLSARYQTERYYLPIVFIWQTLLPLFLLALAPEISFSFLRTDASRERARRMYRLSIPVMLVGYELVVFVALLGLDYAIPLH
jgi:hypothetical protein